MLRQLAGERHAGQEVLAMAAGRPRPSSRTRFLVRTSSLWLVDGRPSVKRVERRA